MMKPCAIASRLQAVQQRIETARDRSPYGNQPRLVAVSKTWPIQHIQKAVDAGQLVLGENKLQESQEKIPAMSRDIEWHYIGGLQRNKVRKVMQLFDVIHSVDSLKLARYCDAAAADLGAELKRSPRVLLQVNLGNESTKGGFQPLELQACFAEMLALKHIQIQGLMSIPPRVETPEDARSYFCQLRQLRDQFVTEFADYGEHAVRLSDLSMGMSQDFEVAIEEGATIVRVGSSIFGTRNQR